MLSRSASRRKVLKCFLLAQEVEVPKTHDVRLLCEMCMKIDMRLCDVHKESSLLTRYAVIPRYPAEIEFTESDAALAIQYAETVINFVKTIL